MALDLPTGQNLFAFYTTPHLLRTCSAPAAVGARDLRGKFVGTENKSEHRQGSNKSEMVPNAESKQKLTTYNMRSIFHFVSSPPLPFPDCKAWPDQ